MENEVFNSTIVETGDDYIKFSNGVCLIYEKVTFLSSEFNDSDSAPFNTLASKTVVLPFAPTNVLSVIASGTGNASGFNYTATYKDGNVIAYASTMQSARQYFTSTNNYVLVIGTWR